VGIVLNSSPHLLLRDQTTKLRKIQTGEPQLAKIQDGGPRQLGAENSIVVFKGSFCLVSLSDQGDTIDQEGINAVLPPTMIRMKVKNLVQAPPPSTTAC
jgi:hypothetical protein